MKILKSLLLLTIIFFLTAQLKAQEGTEESFKSGQEALASGNYQKAIEYFKTTLDQNSKKTEAYYYIGFSCQKLADFNSAISYYKEAINYCPQKQQLSYIGLAQCEENLHNSSSFTHYKFAVSFIPGYEDIFKINIGRVTQNKVDAYETLLEFHPGDQRILKKLILSYEIKGQLNDGTALLKSILREKGFF